MKQLLTILSLLFFFSACSQQRKFDLTNDIAKDVKTLLPEGLMKFDVLDKVRQNPRLTELTEKVQESTRANYDWFLEYSSNVKPGQPMPYHQNFGLTEKEYTELQDIMNDIELESSGILQYNISYSKNGIRLIPTDTIKNKSISINLYENTVEFDNQRLSFNDTIRITDAKNGFKSEWFGYQWIYEKTNDFEMSDFKDLSNLEMQQYKFTIGFLKQTGKVYIQIKGREMVNGLKTVNYEFPLVEN